MKTLYEILEVSETASNEIIEKAYKVLAKKYHPDLQPAEKKAQAEKAMKEINEAYDILSDKEKRDQYDAKLKLQRQQEAERKQQKASYYENVNQNNYNQTTAQTKYQRKSENQNVGQSSSQNAKQKQEEMKRRQKMEQEIQEEIQAEYEQRYQEAYENYLRSLGYRIKYKWTLKNYKDFFITIVILIGICAILWFFPPTHKLIIDFYESNHIIKTIVDVIGRVITGIWNAICSIFE